MLGEMQEVCSLNTVPAVTVKIADEPVTWTIQSDAIKQTSVDYPETPLK